MCDSGIDVKMFIYLLYLLFISLPLSRADWSNWKNINKVRRLDKAVNERIT